MLILETNGSQQFFYLLNQLGYFFCIKQTCINQYKSILIIVLSKLLV